MLDASHSHIEVELIAYWKARKVGRMQHPRLVAARHSVVLMSESHLDWFWVPGLMSPNVHPLHVHW